MCVYMYAYLFINIYIYICISIYIYIYAYLFVYIYAYLFIYICYPCMFRIVVHIKKEYTSILYL